MMANVQWFMECGNFSNESVQRVLAEWAISDYESKHAGILGNDNKKHNVIQIPATFVNKMRGAKRVDKRFIFRFWKRNGSEGKIYPADFVEQKTPTKKFRVTKKMLKALQITKKERERER